MRRCTSVRHGNKETSIYTPSVIHTIHSLVQAQLRYNCGEGTIHLIRGIPSSYTLFNYASETQYTLSHIPPDTQDCGDTTITILLLPRSTSDITVVSLIEVTTVARKLDMRIWKLPVVWGQWPIRTRMWPWSHGRWHSTSTWRCDASNISPIHMVWQMRP